MRSIKKTILFILVAILVFGLFACSSSEVIATVNGVQITMDEYDREINALLYYYGTDNESLEDFFYESYGDAEYAKDEANAFRDSVLDTMITTELLLMQAKELGLDEVTEAEQQEIDTLVEETIQSYKDYYRTAAEQEAELDASIDVDKRAEELYMQFMQDAHLTQEYIEELAYESFIQEKVYAYYMDEFELTEEDYKEYYDGLLAEQKEMDETSPETALDYYLNYGYELNVYVPSKAETEVKSVSHILTAIDDETMDEIDALEYEESDPEAAQALREQALEEIKPQAEEILAKVLAGEDFDKLMKEYSADYQEFGSNVYDVYEGGYFVEEFNEASMALENVGDVSELTSSVYGWHIIKFISVPKSGPIPFEDVKEDIIALASEDLEMTYWTDLVAEWLDAADVTRISFLEADTEAE